jgi:hypothetical protein
MVVIVKSGLHDTAHVGVAPQFQNASAHVQEANIILHNSMYMKSQTTVTDTAVPAAW